MSKTDHIISSNARSRSRSGFLGKRGRVALLALTTLLMLFVFFTQPQVRAAIDGWISL
ncbi:hypothetical protein [Ruegeria arenilitoris]|uniref:hypothetical protein n=1 Tax=Ruegeria arenilitoris TaxID=1173585 RepID=UPI00148006FB|nr:hypothetical protein [Ruegeria arenilitoris]